MSIALRLREDLRLYEAAPDDDGAPGWVIQDPISNRFFRIGWFEYECLLRWPGDPERIAQDISQRTPMHVTQEDVEEFARFLERNRLSRPSAESMAQLKEQTQAKGWKDWTWWLHHYLFFRVPLVRPDRWLARLTPWLSPLFTRTALALLCFITLCGLWLVTRQWDVFTHSVMDLITPSGLVGFGLALLVSKTLHELGHAVVATRLGLRVAHMGVAFLVMWPMLYTDTGESWRLRSHRQRLAISVAGVSVELALAGVSTLIWALLDDGVLRQAMLYLATTAWIVSLALNLSPFMRFDGYFVLSDLLNFPNLHERAGAMAKTWVRRTILGLPDAYPEVHRVATRRALIGFALVTWVYRLIVFLGIAWAVYTFFFKLLGIFLFIVEIMWFVWRPLWQEWKVWGTRWPEVSKPRQWALGIVIAVIVSALAWPWHLDIHAPGVALPERQHMVFASQPARITQLHEQGQVASGATLVTLHIPELEVRRTRILASMQALEARLTGLMADQHGMGRRSTLLKELEQQRRELAAIDEEIALLTLSAPFAGQWRDLDPALGEGAWVDTQTPLGVVMDPDRWIVDAYVGQREVDRIEPGAQAHFYFSGQTAGVPARVVFVDSTRSQRLSHAMLDGSLGGPIPTHTATQDTGVPVDAMYRVRLQLDKPLPYRQQTRGSAVIQGTPHSVLWQGTQQLISVLIRESGF